MIALGVVARGIIPPNTDEDHVLLGLVETIMPAEGYMLLLVVLVSIVMSSLDSLLNAGAVAFAEDIARPFAGANNTSALAVGRWATVSIAVVAALGTVAVPSIIDGLLICYTIWASAILPALILGLWIRQPRPLAGILSMSAGTFVAAVAIVLFFVMPSAIKVPAIIIPALGAALLAYLVGHLMGSRTSGT